MSIAKEIRSRIDSIDKGKVFTYESLGVSNSNFYAAAKAMERLIRDGIVMRVSKGVFFKPKENPFGYAGPSEGELLKIYKYDNGERIAYETGLSLYNKMGLTTQVPNTITLACNKKRINAQINGIKVKSVKSYGKITDSNVPFLRVLDAIKDFNKIPDLDNKSAIAILQKQMKLLSKKSDKIFKLSLDYPPRVRAFTGALLDDMSSKDKLKKLKKSLNPSTRYRFGVAKYSSLNTQYWNIR
ncbi:MAG: DUF6088 family protein [Bacteroidota bacterium]